MGNEFGLFIALIVIVVIGVGVYYLVNVLQETVTRKARVIGKRTETRVSGSSMYQGHSSIDSTTYYYCTFE